MARVDGDGDGGGDGKEDGGKALSGGPAERSKKPEDGGGDGTATTPGTGAVESGSIEEGSYTAAAAGASGDQGR